jgi:hypothetical protein
MSLTRLSVVSAILTLGGCGPSLEEFAKQCQRVAGIEVQNQGLWREYLGERKQRLAHSKVTVNGKEIDPTDLNPVVGTENFRWTNDWVREGHPSIPKRKPYRNDEYVIQIGTGQPVARFRNLNMSVPSLETTLGYSCTADYPHLYTGGRQHRGSIANTSR